MYGDRVFFYKTAIKQGFEQGRKTRFRRGGCGHGEDSDGEHAPVRGDILEQSKVEVLAGGRKLIRITDNGEGMTPEDATATTFPD